MKYLYIGRFQPFHLGHLDAITQALAHGASHIYIALGSPDLIDRNNPRSITQRKEMITLGLQEAKISPDVTSFEILPDFATDLERYSYIIDQLPNFDVVMSGNTWVQEIFDACPHTVFDPEHESKIDVHATQIRQRLHEGKQSILQSYLSPSVYTYLHTQTIRK